MKKSKVELAAGFDAVLRAKIPTIVPGVVDAATARLVELHNFPLALISGSITTLSLLALPDDGNLTSTQLVEHVRRISSACNIGLVVDIDNGYGNVKECANLAHALAEAGAGAIIIEDAVPTVSSINPTPLRLENLEAKIRACKEVFGKSGPRLFARTNARTINSVAECAERLASYGDAGADGIFLFGPASPMELLEVHRRVDLPQVAVLPNNADQLGVFRQNFGSSGVKVVLAPRSAYQAALGAFDATLEHLNMRPFQIQEGVPSISAERMQQVYQSP
jgi:2-methylisocitrate lyase-like PEP mutase family enzyme